MDQSAIEPKAFKRIWVFHILTIALLTITTVMVLSARDEYPDKVPAHFGIDGKPDRWTDKGSAETDFMLFFPFMITGLLYAIVVLNPLLRKHPGIINIPNKEKFLALPPERQAVFFDALDEMGAAMACAFNVMFLFLRYTILQVTLGKAEAMVWWGIWPGLALVGVVMIWQTYRLLRIANSVTK